MESKILHAVAVLIVIAPVAANAVPITISYQSFDFTQIPPLQAAERLFYSVGVSPDDALDLLDIHLANLKDLARFILAHGASRALDDERVLTHRAFVEGLDLTRTRFDPDAFRAHWVSVSRQKARYPWPFDLGVLDPFRPDARKAMGKKMGEN